jgi:8-oxo-dGTP pyrophosphatase MutT (NUDIX family)
MSSSELFCNNCGKYGHLFHQCKFPITSAGVIVFRYNKQKIEYLMVCRKDSLGYIDFLRAKFSLHQKYYILNMCKQMTVHEKTQLRLKYSQYHEQNKPNFIMKDKIQSIIQGVTVNNEFYDLKTILDESDKFGKYEEPEWGFAKGRRNVYESDYNCALREFSEETGYPISSLINLINIVPYEETFTGSNYNSYKHKYFLMYMDYNTSLEHHHYQKTEISNIQWKSFEECIHCIRPYNLEKKKMLSNIDSCIRNLQLYCIDQK